MRYAVLNNEVDFCSRFGTFIPGVKDFRKLPEPADQNYPGGGLPALPTPYLCSGGRIDYFVGAAIWGSRTTARRELS